MISASPEELYKIACRAIEHQKAQDSTRSAKHAYHLAWQRFETGDDAHHEDSDYAYIVHQEERISTHHQLFHEACAATEAEHNAYKAAKRTEYNAKRRLGTAIRGIK